MKLAVFMLQKIELNVCFIWAIALKVNIVLLSF